MKERTTPSLQLPPQPSQAQTSEVDEDDISQTSESPALKNLLALHDQMEREKETVVRQIQEERTALTEAYQAKIAKLDALLAKVAPELITRPTPPTQAAVPARAAALSPTAGRTDASARWNGQKFCPFCQIPGHDGRAHRGQAIPKKWTMAELTVFGYMPPKDQPQLPANYDQIPSTRTTT